MLLQWWSHSRWLCLQNLVRGKGLLCRSLIRSQIASPTYTPVFASLVAVINCKLPDVGALLVTRLIMQFRRSLKRNDRSICVPATIFLAHLVNQQVRCARLADIWLTHHALKLRSRLLQLARTTSA